MTGNSERFDERDTVFARRDLKPGMDEYAEYYREHPDIEDVDAYCRSLPGFGAFTSPADMSMFDAPAALMRRLGEPDCVDGTPALEQVRLSPARATLKIKAFARRLGADLVGVSLMDPAYAYSHRGRFIYPQERWGSEIEVNHCYAISLGFREDIELIRTAPRPSEMMETGLIYLKSAITSVVLANYIRMLGFAARAHHFRNYQVLSVPLAVDAGLGELSRAGFLVTKRHGNCLRLSTVTTDIPLLLDKPVDIGVQHFCEICKLCAESCPSGSIPSDDKVIVRGVSKWQIDAVKCITYWNKVGTDCGMCISSCPWTEPDNLLHRISAEAASRSKLARHFLLWVYPIIYGKYRPRPMPEWMDLAGKVQQE